MTKKIFGGLVLLFLVIFIVIVLTRNDSNQNSSQRPSITQLINISNSNSNDPSDLRQAWSRGRCQGSGMVQFGTLPMRPEDFSVYQPYGLVTDAHVTPIDHGYFSPTNFNSPRDTYEVRAVADGVIVSIGSRTRVVGDINHNQAKAAEYRLEIEHTCNLYSYFDLVTSLSPEIMTEFNKGGREYWAGRIPIKEGQVIGRIGGQTLDFAVYNNDLRLNFINPKSYVSESWKIHTDDPFKYFKEPAKSILVSKNVRKAEPIAGKIDYDIPGKLVGNWFMEGTNGYRGINQDRYWDGHLAIVYDYIDPSQIRFSIGNFGGKAAQFGVRNNQPDPATIGSDSGLVKYELTEFMYYDQSTGAHWNQMTAIDRPASKNTPYIQGVALLQMLDEGKLKVEVFPGKTGDQVSSFTPKARTYIR